jgi:hypothetical protein
MNFTPEICTIIDNTVARYSRGRGPGREVAIRREVTNAVATALKENGNRIRCILGSDEARSRPQFSRHLAYNTSIPADEAVTMLALSGDEDAGRDQQPTPFSQFMDRDDQPDVGASFTLNTDCNDDESAARTRELATKLGLKGFTPKG